MTTELKTLSISKVDELIIGMGLAALADRMMADCDDGPELRKTIKRICDLLDRMGQYGAADNIWTKYQQGPSAHDKIREVQDEMINDQNWDSGI